MEVSVKDVGAAHGMAGIGLPDPSEAADSVEAAQGIGHVVIFTPDVHRGELEVEVGSKPEQAPEEIHYFRAF